MAPQPSASDFTSFYDFVPSSNHRCIFYIAEKAATCRLQRSVEDKTRACEIYNKIVKGPGLPDRGLLEEYARRNLCCKPMKFFKGHRKYVEDTQPSLIQDLATKWLKDIEAGKDSAAIIDTPCKKEPESSITTSPAPGPRARAQTTRSRIPTTQAAMDPQVLWFLSFRDIDPFSQRACIYMTKLGNKCSRKCVEDDNKAARKLKGQISSTDGLPEIGQLMEYATYNCCRSGSVGAGHQGHLKAAKLLRPLAERWLREIRQQRERAATATPTHELEATVPSGSPSQGSKAGSPGQDSIKSAEDKSIGTESTGAPRAESISPTPTEPRCHHCSCHEGRPKSRESLPASPAVTLSESDRYTDGPVDTVAMRSSTMGSPEPLDMSSYSLPDRTLTPPHVQAARRTFAVECKVMYEFTGPEATTARNTVSVSAIHETFAPSKPAKPVRLQGKSLAEPNYTLAHVPAAIESKESTVQLITEGVSADVSRLGKMETKSKPEVPPKRWRLPPSPPVSP